MNAHTAIPTVTYYTALTGTCEAWGEGHDNLDAVAEDYAECRKSGDDVIVWAEYSDGMMAEMTDTAVAIARERCGSQIPDWLLSDDERDEAERDALLDADHERQERHGWGQV